MSLRRGRALLALTLLSAGCEGSIGEPGGRPQGAPADASVAEDAGPTPCEPTATAVPKLLRLSTFEYRNLVSDLLGAPVDPALFARWTPVAEVYGFDTMSETRVDQQAMEEQLATAERLAELLLASPALTDQCPAVSPVEVPVCAAKTGYSARDDFSDAQARECWTYLDSSGAPMIFDNARGLWRKEPDQTVLLWADGAHPGSTVDAVRRWQAPLTGSVLVRGSFADADPGGGDGVMVSILQAGRTIYAEDLPNGGSSSFELPLAVEQGELLDFVVHRKANPSYDTTAFTAALAFGATPRKASWTWEGCVAPTIGRLASRAFRRPLRADELADYQALYESMRRGAAEAGFAEPVDEALKAVLEAVLLSPNLVFKPELVPGGVEPGERSYALASRIALYTRSSIPDEPLWALAAAGALEDPALVRAETLRLLRTDLERFATHFGGQWLAYRDLGPSPLAESMRREAQDVFAAVLRESLGADRLLLPGFTFVDPPLAAHYGLAEPGGEGGPQRVRTELRGGLLAQGGLLSKTGAGSEFRRPIHRGLWVLTRLLCRSLPHIDPATREEITSSLASIDPTLSLPERMALHRQASTRCPQCHMNIDPIGLAMEKFDADGRWRERYPDGVPIMSDLELNGVRVRDPYELARAIADSEEFETCVGTKLLTFALNRGPLPAEQCVAGELTGAAGGARPSLEALAVDALLKGLELTEVSP